MSRLFIAADLDEMTREALSHLLGDLPGAHWTPPDQMHITLKFLGETPAAKMDALRHGLRRIEGKAFTVALKGLGVFPLRGDPETLWIGVHSQALISLRNRMESVLAQAGFAREHRKYHPHLSLARLGQGPVEWLADYLKSQAGISIVEAAIHSFTLFESERHAGGPIYSVIETFPLFGILDQGPEEEEF